MPYFKKLIGQKCYLSPIHLEDAPIFTAWLNDQDVVQQLALAKTNVSLASEKQWLETLVREHVYTIVDAATNRAIGIVGLHAPDHINQVSEMGMFIGEKSLWDQGYGTEALRLLLRYAFDELNLHNITLRVFAFNARAIACYRKMGFKEIGRQRQAHIFHGQRHDIVFMDLLAEEFRAS